MIKIEQINKSFQNLEVLKNITFEIHEKDYYAIMGPSGSGKSTLLYSMSGMDRVDSGRVCFEDTDLSFMKETELSAFRLNKMGFVFQNAQMLKNLSLYDNIILPGLVAKKDSLENIKFRAYTLMKKMEIIGLEKRDLREVSGGQLQRASICRAMINHPKVLFMDEPTGALNSLAADQVLRIIEDLNNEGVTIVMVTHDQRVAARAKKVIYIEDGVIAGVKDLTALKDKDVELDVWLKSFHKKN